MIGVILYTLMEILNFYLVYKVVFRITFTKRKTLYVFVILLICAVQIAVLYLVGDLWKDVIILGMGLIGAIILTERKRWKSIILYPVVYFFSSFINILGSYGIAAIMGTTQDVVCDSTLLTLLSESVGIGVFCLYGIWINKRRREDISLPVWQYILMLVGVLCFFPIVAYAQGFQGSETELIEELKNIAAIASVAIALLFVILSLWQQNTRKKALRYQMENERYEMFLAGQEEHIRMLLIEDEKRRKLRHDMNAHMLAMRMMVEKEEWDMLREYLGKIEQSLVETSVNKYTLISAVDAIVDDWQRKALQYNAEWSWEGTLGLIDGITIFELCVLFSNLLSNSVEAIQKLDKDRRIEIRISQFQGRQTIRIGNNYRDVLMEGGKPITLKADKVFHGLGLKNVEEIIQQHDGNIDYEISENWFQVNIVL